jgi:hypothetical protein
MTLDHSMASVDPLVNCCRTSPIELRDTVPDCSTPSGIPSRVVTRS